MDTLIEEEVGLRQVGRRQNYVMARVRHTICARCVSTRGSVGRRGSEIVRKTPITYLYTTHPLHIQQPTTLYTRESSYSGESDIYALLTTHSSVTPNPSPHNHNQPLIMSDSTFHTTKEDVKKMESKDSNVHGGNVAAGSEAATMQSIVDSQGESKKDIINERQVSNS